jgi:hypothetical protein
MELKFITIQKYEGRVIPVLELSNPLSETQENSWLSIDKAAAYDEEPTIMEQVEKILTVKGEKIIGLAALDYEDIGQLGNKMYRIECQNNKYFLKILGRKKSNRREILAWKTFGYDFGTGKRKRDTTPIPALPVFVLVLENLNAVLTHYFPGVLKPIVGGNHEFPLILELILYFSKAFDAMHQHGLLYMDLHPNNILYKVIENKFIKGRSLIFYLTDMGGVRPICSKCYDDPVFTQWKTLNNELNDELCVNRWTKGEVMPPYQLYPLVEGCPSHLNPGYDFHTIARTALILGGFDLGTKEDWSDYSNGFIEEMGRLYPQDFVLENPLAPLQEEVETLYDLLKPPLFYKKPFDSEAVYQLFKDFFLKRADFIAQYLQTTSAGEIWTDTLLNRVNLYHMALEKRDKQKERFKGEVIRRCQGRESIGRVVEEIDLLNGVVSDIQNGNHEEADRKLQTVSDKRILKISKNACYAYDYHREVLSDSWGQRVSAPGVISLMDKLPEKRTLEMLAQDRNVKLGTLVRVFN